MASVNRRLELVGERDLKFTEAPIPEPEPKGLVIKTHFAGICHSDLHYWKNQHTLVGDIKVPNAVLSQGFTFPVVLGHEVAGEVFALGDDPDKDSPNLKVGDKVLVYPWRGCGDCDYCRADVLHGCPKLTENIVGICRDGGFQTYVRVKSRDRVIKVPEGVPLDLAATLCCSGLTAFNAISKAKEAVERSIRITGQAGLLIIGAGGLGLWAVQWAKAILPKECKVFVADIAEDKLETAKHNGADDTVHWDTREPDDKLVKLTKEKCGNLQAAIDFVGITPTVDKAYKVLQGSGTIVLVGIAGGGCPIPLSILALKAFNIRGVFVGSFAQLEEALKYVAEKKVKGIPISHHKLEHVEEVFEKLMKGNLMGRAVVSF